VTGEPLVGAVRRAELVTTDNKTRLAFHYNPDSLNIVKTAEWSKPKTPGPKEFARPQFVGASGRTLTLTIILDAVDSPGRDVRAAVDQLISWTTSTDTSWRQHKTQPSLLRLHWGGYSYFPGYLSKVDATYSLFSPQGVQLRAKVLLTMEEVPEPQKRQNPTSGGVPDRRAVVLAGGDTLASLARQEYGDPNLWRALAVANGVDDPMRLAPGTPLVVPPLGEARDLAGSRRG
jgi:hypothetical protein